jgi:hypothetical protein
VHRCVRVALAGALLAAVTSCSSDSEGKGDDERGADETSSSSATSTSSSSPEGTSASESTASPSATDAEPASELTACALLDLPSLEGAGLPVNPPQETDIRASDGAEAEESLDGREALLLCDAGFTASAQINDFPSEQEALDVARQSVDTAADTPTAVRTELPSGSAPFGAMVVDPEYQSASVQFQLRDLHVAIVLSYGGGQQQLSVGQVQDLLATQLDTALDALG